MGKLELVVFFVLALCLLVLLFFVIKYSTKSNKKVELLEILVEQQDYQIALLKQILSTQGGKPLPEYDDHIDSNRPPKKTPKTEPIVAAQKEYEDLGVSQIFPER